MGYTWKGVVCQSCESYFEQSQTNNVDVSKFEYCPICSSGLVEFVEDVDLEYGDSVEEVLFE